MSRASVLPCMALLLAAWLGVTVTSASQASAKDDAPRMCVLSGKVVDLDTEEPVPYFRLLHMKMGGILVEHLETDENGRFQTTAPLGSERYFQLDQSKRGTYIIDWDQQSKFEGRPFRGKVNEDMTDLVFKVKLWPTRKLTGNVADPEGRAVGDASICVHCNVPKIKTDANGVFDLQVAPTDRDFDLFAISADEELAGQVHLKAGTTTTTITMEPTAHYPIRVRDTQGRPVGPFKFLVGLRLNGSMNDCWQRRLQTEADGTFVIDSLCPKTQYHLWWYPDEQVNKTIGQFGQKDVDLAQLGPNESIELIVPQYLNTITGIVRDTEGNPTEQAKVTVHTRHGIQAQHRWGRPVVTDEDGRFRLEGLADGLALFHVHKEGCRMKHLWRPTDSAGVDVTLQPLSQTGACEIQVVVDAFEPMANVPVRLDFVTGDPGRLLGSRTIETDAKGKVEFTFEDSGQDGRVYARISCDTEGYELAYNGAVSDADTQVMLVLHESGPCWSGRIVDPQERPIAGAKLYLTSMSQRVQTPNRTTPQSLEHSFFEDPCERTFITETDHSGRFALHRLSKQDFVRVTVKADGFQTEELDLSPDYEGGRILRSSGIDQAEDYVFTLLSGVAVVKGALIDAASGEPVPDTPIRLVRADNHTREVRTDEDGTFAVADLEPGQYVPVIRSRGDTGELRYVCEPQVFTAQAGAAAQVTFEARLGIVLKGRVVQAGTEQAPSAQRMYLAARLKSGQTIATEPIAPDGTWELLLPPGPVELYYEEFREDARRFIASEQSLSMTVEDRSYGDFILELDAGRNLSLGRLSLVGRPLPALESLKLFGSKVDLDAEKTLVCLFDMGQRPSRNRVLKLAGQMDDLTQGGVAVVLIQAVPIDRTKLSDWIEDNDIILPVGMVQAGDDLKVSWGVRSLPWSILTDEHHNVVSEGFDLGDLDKELEKIGE